MASDDLTLHVGGKAYSGWTLVSVVLSIDNIAGGYQIELNDRWTEDMLRWPLKPGDECTVKIGEDTVITGYVDEVNPAYDANSHSISVTGRDKTGDLVDCSAVQKPDQWSGLTATQIAAKLCAPHSVNVSADVDVGEAFSPFKLEPGETVFEAIERLAKMRALLMVSDGLGGLKFTRSGQGEAASEKIEEGVNILAANAKYSWSERYSEYTVKGQQSGKEAAKGKIPAGAEFVQGDDAAATKTASVAKSAAHPSGQATDAGVTRYRPLVVIAESTAKGAGPQERAAWEATVRAGRSTRYNVTVQGWRQESGKLWPLNGKVSFKSDLLDVEATLVIAEIRFSLDSGGTKTELSLAPEEAYSKIREVPEAKKGKQGANGKIPAGAEKVTGDN